MRIILYDNFRVLVCPQCLGLLPFKPLVPFLYDKRLPSFPQFIKEPQRIEFPVVSFGEKTSSSTFIVWELFCGFNAYVCSSLLPGS